MKSFLLLAFLVAFATAVPVTTPDVNEESAVVDNSPVEPYEVDEEKILESYVNGDDEVKDDVVEESADVVAEATVKIEEAIEATTSAVVEEENHTVAEQESVTVAQQEIPSDADNVVTEPKSKSWCGKIIESVLGFYAKIFKKLTSLW